MPFDPNNPKDNVNYTEAQRARYAAYPTSQFWDKYNKQAQGVKPSDSNSLVQGYNRFMYGAGHPLETFLGRKNIATDYVDKFSPSQFGFRALENTSQGEYKQAAGDVVRGVATAALLNFAPGAKFFPNSAVGRVATNMIIPPAAMGAVNTFASALGLDEPKPKPQTASSVLPGRSSYTLTPEQARVIAEANRPENRTDAAGNTGMGGRRTVGFPYPEIVIPTQLPQETPGMQPIPTVVEPAAPPAPGLLPLTPEQLASIGEERTAAEKAYEDLINMYKLQEEQGRQGYVSDVQSARRQAAGSAVDVGSSLMGTGLGDSPAAAFGAGQMVEGTRQAREMADTKTLNQLLGQLASGRTQAQSQKEATMVGINRLMNEYRLRNTLASQQAAYNNMGGL